MKLSGFDGLEYFHIEGYELRGVHGFTGGIHLMKNFYINRFFWWSAIYFIRGCGLPFHLALVKLPQNEYQKLETAAAKNDIVIVFNAGGWGNTPLNKAADFTPILEGIRRTLTQSGYSVSVIPYYRTLPGLAGRIAGTREQLNSFKQTCQIQIEDMKRLAAGFPEKRFIIVGFSIGGGLSGKTLKSLAAIPNIYGITMGTPAWYRTFSSEKSLVLNNDNQDPLCVGDVNTIAVYILRSPFEWLRANLKGNKLSLALAIKLPHHKYSWESVGVGELIVKFLQTNFK